MEIGSESSGIVWTRWARSRVVSYFGLWSGRECPDQLASPPSDLITVRFFVVLKMYNLILLNFKTPKKFSELRYFRSLFY